MIKDESTPKELGVPPEVEAPEIITSHSQKDRRVLTEETFSWALQIVVYSVLFALFGFGGVYLYQTYGIGYLVGSAVAIWLVTVLRIETKLDTFIELLQEEEK